MDDNTTRWPSPALGARPALRGAGGNPYARAVRLLGFIASALLLVAAATAVACGGSSASVPGGDAGTKSPACVPGQQVNCGCPGGGSHGVQVCAQDGSGYGSCDCGDATTSPPQDGGTGPTSDAGVDGGDGGSAEASPGSPYTFFDPLQIDASSLFNEYGVNTVATTAEGGAALTPMDGTGAGENDDFPTQSKLVALGSGGTGLPDNGAFQKNGTTTPAVQLAWNNSVNSINSVSLSSTTATDLTLNVPPYRYNQVQLYATGTGGSSQINYTLNYASGQPVIGSLVLADWCVYDSVPANTYVLASIDRVEFNGTVFNSKYLCAIFAINLNPDPARTLVSFTFSDTGSGVGSNTSYFTFYGATAW
jgi:hypothetical protein